MEDPANKLPMDDELKIMGDNKFKIIEMKKKICQSLIDTEQTISAEIATMKTHKLSKEDVESQEVEIEGISYTSLMTYLNESFLENVSDQSHRQKPGTAIANFINKNFDETKEDSWREFPLLLMVAVTANTYFFTRMIEMC